MPTPPSTIGPDFNNPSNSVNANFQCAAPGPLPSQAQANVIFSKIMQAMFGKDLDPTDWDYRTGLDSVSKGVPVAGVMSSLATGTNFDRIVWNIAVAAACDYCGQLLGINTSSAQFESLKRGYICNNFPFSQDGPGFGWMLASLVQNSLFKRAHPGTDFCNYMPPPAQLPDFTEPCFTTKTTAL